MDGMGPWEEPARQVLELAQRAGVCLKQVRCFGKGAELLAVVGEGDGAPAEGVRVTVREGMVEFVGLKSGPEGLAQVLAQVFDRLREDTRQRLLVSGLAHELKNSVTILHGRLELLEAGGDADCKAGVAAVRQEAERLTLALEDLLAGASPVRRQRVFLQSVLDNCRRRVEALRPRGVALVVAMDAKVGAGALWTDPRKLEKILVNFLLNAFQAPGTTWVQLAAREAGEEIELTVSDDGPGVEASLREHLFEPFVTSKPYGHGLGLAICRILAQQLKGRLGYRELDPHGACFWLRLAPNP
jgi:signal transduction histidine kinase